MFLARYSSRKINTIMYHCCSSDECHARVHRDILQSQAQHMVAERILPNVARHTLYRTYVRAKYGCAVVVCCEEFL